MILIKQKAPSKSWRLVRNKITGDIFTGDHPVYYTNIETLAKQIAAEAADEAGGQPYTPREVNAGYWRGKVAVALLEQLDHIPFYRGSLKFHSIHNGTSSIQIRFESATGGSYILVGDSANDFFQRVGKGTIKMDAAGYYEFNFSFVKKGEKVFMTLEPDDLHV